MMTVICVLALFFASPVWASDDDDCNHQPDGGNIDVYTSAYGQDEDLTEDYGSDYGSAAGFSGQGGGAGHLTGSFSGEGEMEGHLSATGASIGHMETYDLDMENGEGVGANNENWSQGFLSGSIDGEGTGGYGLEASGLSESATCAGSYYGGDAENAPTYGLAEQTAQGYFTGQGGEEFDGTLSEEFSAGVESFGSSFSESYGQEYEDDGNHISALGSNVGNLSEVQVTADNLPNGMETGWHIDGQAGTVTEQSQNHKAKALGQYNAQGTGDTTAKGNAEGYSYTSTVTPKSGMGQINNSQAGMSVGVTTNPE
ncbi:MAG: hypothetical protein ACLFTS_00370 [Candidatus Paceibacterota bacterium]